MDKRYKDVKFYDRSELKEGFVAVPVVVESRWRFIEMGGDPESIMTWKIPSGRPYLVTFAQVEEEKYDSYMKDFENQIHDFFDRYGENSYHEKFSRCIRDGKPCSLHNHCSNCKRLVDETRPYSEEDNPLLKDVRDYSGAVSYDSLVEEGFEGATVYNDAEEILLWEDLLAEAKTVNELYPVIIRLAKAGFKPGEIIEKLGLEKSSTNYDLVTKALKFAWNFLTKK